MLRRSRAAGGSDAPESCRPVLTNKIRKKKKNSIPFNVGRFTNDMNVSKRPKRCRSVQSTSYRIAEDTRTALFGKTATLSND